ncbi:MAG: hypothetical protein FWD96_00570 [Defluviitaleaceae bacterium]|nr:hypothetical protein [Defluviitaleaceae bacterium]
MKTVIKECALSSINDMIDSADLFICHSSFEARCLSVSLNIDVCKFNRSIVFYVSGYSKEEEYRKKLHEVLGVTSELIELGSVSTQSDPMQSLKNTDFIMDILQQKKSESTIRSVLIDITTFTHESLLVLLKILTIVLNDATVTCVYNNAEAYDPSHQKEKKWLSKGVHTVRAVLGYSGNTSPIQKTHLVVIVGYEAERAARIIEMVEPVSLSLGYGKPNNALTVKDKEANEYYTELVRHMTSSYADIPEFNVMCDDPYLTCQVLLEHVAQFDKRNIIVVPLNNKLSTIGVAFAAMKNTDIQVCYAPADTYNSDSYSEPGDKCYIVDITSELRICGQ